MNTKQISAKEKKWILKSNTDPRATAEIEKIASTLRLNPIVAELLYNRGYTTPSDAKKFLYMDTLL